MNWKKPGIWLGIASMLIVVAFVTWDSKRISPGPLAAAHAHAREDLESDCEACHGTAGSSMSSACESCHEDVARQIVAKAGLHGTMTADASNCGACHSDHHGVEHELVSDGAFAQAGVPDRSAFRHEGLGFELAGDHVALKCERCHEHALDVVLAAGTKRFLGKSQACASCHEDPHEGKLAECAACHGETEPFATVATFVHPDTFELKGRHAGVGCLQCHPKGTSFAIEASGISAGTPNTTRASRDCRACHASPHRDDFIGRVATALTLNLDATCATCHSAENGAFQGPNAHMDPALHALTGFELEPPHQDLSCAQCHTSGPLLASAPASATSAESFLALHPGRKEDECRACHVDPHAGQFEGGPFAGGACPACHDALRFQPANFGLSSHARTSFALTGAHEAVACSQCHEQPSPTAPRQFHGTSTVCSECHADAHEGLFDREGLPAIFRGESGCARCHDTSTFGPVVTRPFDHETWTGFALAGAHGRGECADCHPRSPLADDRGRTFGRVQQKFPGPAAQCSTCHADVHGGAFDGELAAHVMARGEGCARCHDVESFHGARQGFAHDQWTRFALTGAHAKSECESCHAPRARPDAQGRTFGLVADTFPGPSDRCETCHVDVHAGAFRAQRCDVCHTTTSFQTVPSSKFDHGRDAHFVLEGAHARAECAACHAPKEGPNGRTLGAAKGTSCQACHEDEHVGQFIVNGKTDCTRCHAPTETFDRPHFDHARDSQFALDVTHAPLGCSKCHVDTPLAGGGSAIRYKPLGTECADCHVPVGR